MQVDRKRGKFFHFQLVKEEECKNEESDRDNIIQDFELPLVLSSHRGPIPTVTCAKIPYNNPNDFEEFSGT